MKAVSKYKHKTDNPFVTHFCPCVSSIVWNNNNKINSLPRHVNIYKALDADKHFVTMGP